MGSLPDQQGVTEENLCLQLIELGQRCHPFIKVASHKNPNKPIPIGSSTVGIPLLQKTTARVIFVLCLQIKGWLEFEDRKDYIFALYDNWKTNPGPYRFQQLLAMVYTNGFSQKSKNARHLVASRIGSVPYLGKPIITAAQFEKDFSIQEGVIVIPNEFWEGLIGKNGVLRNQFQDQCHSEIIQTVSQGLSQFYFCCKQQKNIQNYEASSEARVRASLAGYLQTLNSESTIQNFENSIPLKIVDPACGPGSVLVQTIRQSLFHIESLVRRQGLPYNPSVLIRTIIEKGLHGIDLDPFAVEITRLRIGLEIIQVDHEPMPWPDLSRDVEVGAGVSVVSPFQPPPNMPSEGSKVEFKSTLEWDSRQQKKSPELLIGNLKTICAFLNSEGGTLYIGISDDGNPVGIQGDFDLIKDHSKHDSFENRLREFFKNHIEPIPLTAVEISFPFISGIEICQVTVKQKPEEVTYLVYRDPKTGQPAEEIFVRDGNRTISLKGRKRDQFILSRLSK